MSGIDIYLSLGSNLGDRKANLDAAILSLNEFFGHPCKSISEYIETKAWGFEGDDFLNAVVLYELPEKPCSPLELLDCCKSVEASMGRNDKPQYDSNGCRIYHSRTIDIDILFWGEEKIESERLIIPHKGIADREFVLRPLYQVAKPALREAFPDFFD